MVDDGPRRVLQRGRTFEDRTLIPCWASPARISSPVGPAPAMITCWSSCHISSILRMSPVVSPEAVFSHLRRLTGAISANTVVGAAIHWAHGLSQHQILSCCRRCGIHHGSGANTSPLTAAIEHGDRQAGGRARCFALSTGSPRSLPDAAGRIPTERRPSAWWPKNSGYRQPFTPWARASRAICGSARSRLACGASSAAAVADVPRANPAVSTGVIDTIPRVHAARTWRMGTSTSRSSLYLPQEPLPPIDRRHFSVRDHRPLAADGHRAANIRVARRRTRARSADLRENRGSFRRGFRAHGASPGIVDDRFADIRAGPPAVIIRCRPSDSGQSRRCRCRACRS